MEKLNAEKEQNRLRKVEHLHKEKNKQEHLKKQHKKMVKTNTNVNAKVTEASPMGSKIDVQSDKTRHDKKQRDSRSSNGSGTIIAESVASSFSHIDELEKESLDTLINIDLRPARSTSQCVVDEY
ncbi:unnamed protein product, partial [Candidula unifasciata]